MRAGHHVGTTPGMSGSGAEALAADVFRALARDGLGVVDVGARDGVGRPFAEVAQLVEIVGFEPDVEECSRLTREEKGVGGFRSVTFLPTALGNATGTQTLHVCRGRGNSSCYLPNSRFLRRFPDPRRYAIEAEATVSMRPLDELGRTPGAGTPVRIDFLKVDTQGFELQVLRGARATIASQVVGIEVEVEFAPLYEGQPLFRDVDAFLADCGFVLFKLRRQEWVRSGLERDASGSAGQLIFGDALYLRDPLNEVAPWSPKDAHQAEALILVAALYDLHDFALELTEAESVGGLIDAVHVRRYLLARSQDLGRPYRLRERLMDLLRFGRACLQVERVPDLLRLLESRRVGRYARRWPRGDADFYSRRMR